MGKYMYYLSSTLVKKKGIWITALIGMIGVFFMTYLQIKSANNNESNKVNNLATFDFFLPFIFGSLMSTFFIIHAFKSGEHDGTELLVVAKPLTRGQIIFGKFFVVIIAQILYQVILMPLYGSLGILDKVATSSEKIKYVFSLVIGGLIVQIFMIGLITIFASVVGRIGTIVISILFAAIIPIASFIMAPVTGAYDVTSSVSKKSGAASNYQLLKSLNPNDEKNSENVKLIYGKDAIDRFKKADSKNNYKKVSYFDPWYQWSRFFTLFIDKNGNSGDGTGVLKYYESKESDFKPSDFDIYVHMKDKSGQDIYYVPFKENHDSSYYSNKEKSMKDYITESISAIKDADIINIASEFYKDLLAENMTQAINSNFKNIRNINDFKELSLSDRIILIKRYVENKNSLKFREGKVNNLNALRIIKKINENHNDLMNITKDFEREYFDKDTISISPLKNLNNAIKPVGKEYVKTSIVVVIWSIIGIVLISLSILLYFKRDFK